MHLSTAGNKPVRFIDQPDALPPCLQDLAARETISFDLEFDSHRNSYGVTLCLIQVGTPEACYVIDPMVHLELGGLYALFEDDRIQKIVHSPGEDLRLLHSLGCYPKNLFDTEVVARLLNYEQTSLTALLRDKLDHQMSKGQQKSNWLLRPLTAEQVQYAADDVAWLHRLKEVLVAEAEEKGLMPFVLEEQELLSTTIHRIEAKTNFLKPADLEILSPREQHILNELLRYRDELARDINQPAYRVMSEELVRDLASGNRTPESLAEDRGVHRLYRNSRFASRVSGRLRDIRAAATTKGLSAEPKGRARLTPAEHAARRKAAYDREHKFAPVQQVLVERFGSFAVKLILSNAMVNELLQHTVAVRDLKPAYRQSLIRDAAASLGIDLSEYW